MFSLIKNLPSIPCFNSNNKLPAKKEQVELNKQVEIQEEITKIINKSNSKVDIINNKNGFVYSIKQIEVKEIDFPDQLYKLKNKLIKTEEEKQNRFQSDGGARLNIHLDGELISGQDEEIREGESNEDRIKRVLTNMRRLITSKCSSEGYYNIITFATVNSITDISRFIYNEHTHYMEEYEIEFKGGRIKAMNSQVYINIDSEDNLIVDILCNYQLLSEYPETVCYGYRTTLTKIILSEEDMHTDWTSIGKSFKPKNYEEFESKIAPSLIVKNYSTKVCDNPEEAAKHILTKVATFSRIMKCVEQRLSLYKTRSPRFIFKENGKKYNIKREWINEQLQRQSYNLKAALIKKKEERNNERFIIQNSSIINRSDIPEELSTNKNINTYLNNLSDSDTSGFDYNLAVIFNLFLEANDSLTDHTLSPQGQSLANAPWERCRVKKLHKKIKIYKPELPEGVACIAPNDKLIIHLIAKYKLLTESYNGKISTGFCATLTKIEISENDFNTKWKPIARDLKKQRANDVVFCAIVAPSLFFSNYMLLSNDLGSASQKIYKIAESRKGKL